MSKVLIAYASAAGSTAEVAEAIGKTLREQGTTVDVRRAKEAGDLGGYDAVVLGTGVRAGRTYAEAAKFLETHQSALTTMPVAGFVVCLTMKEKTDENCRQAEGYLDAMFEAVPGVQPVHKGMFAGNLDYARLPWLLGQILKWMKKEPGGDYRDWDAIRDWAANLPPAFSGA
jgi:menaquinone-dependent protoporphyrinogen oxidase